MEMNEFEEYCKENTTNILISHPRSGRVWLSRVLTAVIYGDSGNLITPIQLLDLSSLPLHLCFTHSPETPKKLGDNARYIFLFRDPRDVFLSRCYALCYHEGSSTMTDEIIESGIDDLLAREKPYSWGYYFDVFESVDAEMLYVQYESLCLSPVAIIQKILDFVGVEAKTDMQKTVHDLDAIKIVPDLASRPELLSTKFPNGVERYNAHCQKWKSNVYVDKRASDKIWNEYSEIMKRYGYLRNEHDIKEDLTWIL